ncbi:MAG: penicillin-binding protein 1A [Proteobacteria bacterium]|nr:penicillin-binding protein 1A [Pseudomonadota bacterium]
MLKTFVVLMSFIFFVALATAGGGLYVFYEFGRGLPDYRQLARYEPPVMTRVQAGDGRLLAEYAEQKRVFVPKAAMPKLVIQAFLSAEDKNFYYHPGVDIAGIARAVVINLKNVFQDRRPVGASTITQQVAKNFLLTNAVSLDRKVKEAILAFRIERALSKDRILELYLNEIYLGFSAYGVASAAINYFNKSLDDLTISEAAFLAALPKAPSNYNPYRRPEAAKGRRDWVIDRMLENGHITAAEAAAAAAVPLEVVKRRDTEFVRADFFAEEVRRELSSKYGENDLYKGGLSVRTTLDPKLQEIADQALRDGLEAYDRRHGWRGPFATIDPAGDWLVQLSKIEVPADLPGWRLAAVRRVEDGGAEIGLDDGSQAYLPLAELRWARKQLKNGGRGASVRRAGDALAVGDVILVDAVSKNSKGDPYPEGTYGMRQIPEINGAIVALDPHTGRVLAMSGGYSFAHSKFNRAVQAKRQPGSAFKPFVYLAALDSGYSPSTLILDAPFVIDQGPGLPKWRPANYTKKFYGPSTMRLGIEKSRNLMTVRLAQTIGIDKVADYAKRFGVDEDMPHRLSMSLGAGETTLLNLTTAYAMIVNGGKKIVPTLIDRIQDRDGRTVFRHDNRQCLRCKADFWTGQEVPKIPDPRPQVTTPESAFQMVSMLEGVVQRGTGRRIKEIGKPLAGKTGTTNESLDTWFVGFSPDLAVGVFAGFDTPRSLGRLEQGASVAAPIFKDFMASALAEKPTIPFRIPPGIQLVRVDSTDGLPVATTNRNVILEAFKTGSVPSSKALVLEGVSTTVSAPRTGTGGLY